MRETNKRLTREMLEDLGIYAVYWDIQNQEWWVDRYWYKNNSKNKRHIHLKISLAVCKHKYTQDKVYPAIVFSYKSKTQIFPLGRFIYAWFYGDVPEGMVVDHVDNDPFNNRVENLQLLSPEDNLAKRYVDNPTAYRNQWDVIKGR